MLKKEKKEKKPLPKALRVAGFVANVGLYNDGLAFMPGAIKRFAENEKKIEEVAKAAK